MTDCKCESVSATWCPKHRWKLCRLCGCPMKPKRVKKKPGHFDHAHGCPYNRNPDPDMLKLYPLRGK